MILFHNGGQHCCGFRIGEGPGVKSVCSSSFVELASIQTAVGGLFYKFGVQGVTFNTYIIADLKCFFPIVFSVLLYCKQTP